MAKVIKQGNNPVALSEVLTFEGAYLETLDGKWRLWNGEPTVEEMEGTAWE